MDKTKEQGKEGLCDKTLPKKSEHEQSDSVTDQSEQAGRKRGQGEDGRFTKRKCLARHLSITGRLLDIIEAALSNDDEMYYYIETLKSAQDGSIYAQERLRTINETRLGRLVKTLGEVIELQRLALSIPGYKESSDAHLAGEKERRERETAEQKLSHERLKLELELLKLERMGDKGERSLSASLLDALGTAAQSAGEKEEEGEEEGDEQW